MDKRGEGDNTFLKKTSISKHKNNEIEKYHNSYHCRQNPQTMLILAVESLRRNNIFIFLKDIFLNICFITMETEYYKRNIEYYKIKYRIL